MVAAVGPAVHYYHIIGGKRVGGEYTFKVGWLTQSHPLGETQPSAKVIGRRRVGIGHTFHITKTTRPTSKRSRSAAYREATTAIRVPRQTNGRPDVIRFDSSKEKHVDAPRGQADRTLQRRARGFGAARQVLWYGRMSDAKQGMREAEEARRGLADTCLDNDLLNALAEVNAHQRDANNRRCELEKEIREL